MAILAPLLVAASAAEVKDTYHPLWKSGRFVQKPFPDEWRPENPPATERDLAAYKNHQFDEVTIRPVIARFGIPDRYLVLTRPRRSGEYNWLIYDLPDGYTVAFYVMAPPTDIFAAGVIIDPKGKLLRLIK